MTVNPRSCSKPGPTPQKMKHKCRLPHLVSLVASGLVDILVATEANFDEERVRHAM